MKSDLSIIIDLIIDLLVCRLIFILIGDQFILLDYPLFYYEIFTIILKILHNFPFQWMTLPLLPIQYHPKSHCFSFALFRLLLLTSQSDLTKPLAKVSLTSQTFVREISSTSQILLYS